MTKTLKSIWLSMAEQNWMICSNLYFWRYPYHNLLFLAKYQNKTKKQASKITNKLKWKKSCLIAVEFISDIAWVTHRRLVGSAYQAYSTGFWFKIVWKSLEKPSFHWNCSLSLLWGLRSLKNRLLQKLSMKVFLDPKFLIPRTKVDIGVP